MTKTILKMEVVEQGDLIPQETNAYTSFPMLTRDPASGNVLVLYRKAEYHHDDDRPGMKAHGLEGSLYFKYFFPQENRFSDSIKLVSGENYPSGIIDGVLSKVNNKLFLFFRRYPERPSMYYTMGFSPDTLGPVHQFPSTQAFPGGAEWGHVISMDDGTLLQVLYGGPNYLTTHPEWAEVQPYATQPALFESFDGGVTWQFRSWVGPLFLEPRITANETDVMFYKGKLYAIMRTAGEMPGPLFLTVSEDGGYTWKTPWRTSLFGEAPIFYEMPDGTVLLGFRGFRGEGPYNGGTYAISVFDPEKLTFSEEFTVEEYHGNHYDGGYGDLIWIEETKQLLVTYYFSDHYEPRNPWIRYSLLKLK